MNIGKRKKRFEERMNGQRSDEGVGLDLGLSGRYRRKREDEHTRFSSYLVRQPVSQSVSQH